MSLDLTTATARIARELGESEVAIADALAKTTALLHSAAKPLGSTISFARLPLKRAQEKNQPARINRSPLPSM